MSVQTPHDRWSVRRPQFYYWSQMTTDKTSQDLVSFSCPRHRPVLASAGRVEVQLVCSPCFPTEERERRYRISNTNWLRTVGIRPTAEPQSCRAPEPSQLLATLNSVRIIGIGGGLVDHRKACTPTVIQHHITCSSVTKGLLESADGSSSSLLSSGPWSSPGLRTTLKINLTLCVERDQPTECTRPQESIS